MRTKSIAASLSYLFFCLFSFAFFFSCKKIDVDKENQDQISVQERFLKLPSNANPILKRIVQNLKEQEAKHPFIEQFVKKEGYPLWKFAQLPQSKDAGLPNRDNVTGADTIVNVPVVLDSTKYVKDVLTIKLSDDILYKLFKGEEYALYGFNQDPNRTTPNADDIVAKS